MLQPTRLDEYIIEHKASKFIAEGIEFVWMTHFETSILINRLCDAKVYLEFGAGGSTVLAASLFPSLNVHSYETSFGLCSKLSQLIPSASVTWINVGEVGEWGYPRCSNLTRFTFPLYSNSWLTKEFPDLVLIDGRFRMACFVNVLLEARQRNKPCKILMHDWKRFVEQYGDVLSVFDGACMIPSIFDDLAEFDLAEIDLAKLPATDDLKKLYDQYKYDPR